MFKLVISDDEGKTIIVPLVRDQITVGRQDGNTIRLTERNVSRQHARLVKTEQSYRVEDLVSYNGVTLNGVRIDKQAALQDGDRVGIGDYVIALKAEADLAVANASTAPAAPRISVPSGPSGSPARLVMISAPAPGAEFSIAKGTVRIGRLEELDLCISHRSISREHARVVQRDGVFEVEDLNSANGVRINGVAAKNGSLKSGDLLDLGQVRFRFVGPGETYVFEASEEEHVATAAPAQAGGPRGRTVAVIAVVAAVIGGVLAIMDDGDAKQGGVLSGGVESEPGVVESEPGVVAGAEDDEARHHAAAALEGCRTALASEHFADAVRAAQNGLALNDADPALNECKRSAEDAMRAVEAFEQGKLAFSQGKIEDAYFLFAGLPAGYQNRPELKQAAQRVALGRLTEARQLLRSNPAEAARLANSVLNLTGLTINMVDDAKRLQGSAEKVLASTPPPGASAPTRSSRDSHPSPAAAAAAAAADPDQSPSRVARGCLARGDQRCAVRALEGHTESAQELALLIETYRALGETRKAVKHMESFVTRYPTARQAPQYRQFVAKHDQ